MTQREFTCFKAYDIRGKIGVDLDEDVAYRVGRAVAQHLEASAVVIGWDARATSPALANALAQGVTEAGADVIMIGMAGTEEMYWAVTEFNACAGIEVTASHNPINYNGMKIVKSGSRPLDDVNDFQVVRQLAQTATWVVAPSIGNVKDRIIQARAAYVKRVLQFLNVSALKPLKIVVNSGNGAAGPTFDVIAQSLADENAPLDFVRVHHTPDHTFPNGIPNPLLPKNQMATSDVVKEVGADFGVAFDGDFDRCFFFDESGTFVPGEYVVGLLASIFLEKEAEAKIVHDPRVIWNTQDIVVEKGGVAVQSKTGHAYLKKTMRDIEAVYGGEMSAHHYFRDFAYCDSGMIPWLLVAELVSRSERSLGDWVKDRFTAFPSLGEINFVVEDAATSIARVLDIYKAKANTIDETDGLSLTFEGWRFNLRKSNTEPLVRLNIESKGDAESLPEKVVLISKILGGSRL